MFSAIFLDRDGVINKKIDNDYVKCWEEFEFLTGVPEAIAFLRKHCKYLFIVTNQRGIAKQLMTVKDLEKVHGNMLHALREKGADVDRVYFCPEDEGSYCRKPNIGMAMQAKADFPDIDFNSSLMIGDSISDLEFGKNLEMKCVWISSKLDDKGLRLSDYQCANLIDLKGWIGDLQ